MASNVEVILDRDPSDKDRAGWLADCVREVEPGGSISAAEVERVTGLVWQSPRLMRNVIGSNFFFESLLEGSPRRTTRTTELSLIVLDEDGWEAHDEKRRHRARSATRRAIKSTASLMSHLHDSGRLDDDTRRRLEARAAADSMTLEIMRRTKRRGWIDSDDGKRCLGDVSGSA